MSAGPTGETPPKSPLPAVPPGAGGLPSLPSGLLLTGQLSRFDSPFPPPEFLERYDAIVPGAGERLLAIVEEQMRHGMELDRKEMEHRHQLEDQEVNNNRADQQAERSIERSGQWIALFAVLSVLALCAYGLHLGYPQTAGTIATSVLVVLASVFIFGRTWGAKEQPQSPDSEATPTPIKTAKKPKEVKEKK